MERIRIDRAAAGRRARGALRREAAVADAPLRYRSGGPDVGPDVEDLLARIDALTDRPAAASPPSI
jgi:hypothetical protein